jgi:hypothetical protein
MTVWRGIDAFGVPERSEILCVNGLNEPVAAIKNPIIKNQPPY